jgi:hypothetical protein
MNPQPPSYDSPTGFAARCTTDERVRNFLARRRKVAGRDQSPMAITPVEYGGLQKAYDHFNVELFAGALPDCFITYQRKANSAGYFSPDRFSDRVGTLDEHELALNPTALLARPTSRSVRRWCTRCTIRGSTIAGPRRRAATIIGNGPQK